MSSVRHSSLLNYFLYHAGWLACILGAAAGWPVAAFSAALALLVVHLWLAADRAVEARLMAATLGIGLIVESVHAWSGTYARFPSGMLVAWMSPPWLLVMWPQFATTFRSSLRTVMAHPWRATVFGALGGPIAFLAGERLGAVALATPLVPSLLRLAITWGVALHLCARLVRAAPPATTAVYRTLWPRVQQDAFPAG